MPSDYQVPQPSSVEEVKGNQHKARKCYAIAIKWNESPKIIYIVEMTYESL